MSLTKGCVELLENMKLKLLRIVSHKSLYRTMSKFKTKNLLQMSLTKGCVELLENMKLKILTTDFTNGCVKL